MLKNFIRLVILLALFNGTLPAARALTPQGRHLTGTILQVDAKSCRALLSTSDKAQSIPFIWNKGTDFVAGAKFVPASRIRVGVRVEITLHQPIFGEPFVTKVILLDSKMPS